ncbi:hypothetical protein ACP275_02G090200 [Erythranthe tilingii]
MDKTSISLFLVICLSVVVADAYDENSRSSIGQKISDYWCIAKPGAPVDQLQQFIDFACSKIDCGPIQPGGACFNPNTVQAHASYALNSYFQSTAACKWQIGDVTSVNPSYGNCKYPGPPN